MISQFVWFDLYDEGNREDISYGDFEPWNCYYKTLNDQYILSNSGYCGALFLGVL